MQYLPKFKKQYQKLPAKLQTQFDERLQLFTAHPTAPQLRVHPFRGNYAGYWSMHVNGDLRTLHIKRGDEIIIFALIGTHSKRSYS